ncbi:MAG TPA: DEAD/DEAH box helicase family protein [Fibrobacteria bacterium]|nr:DEAD/DEAH box helicase family protein [Fibrobacteria bacterium]
MKLKFKIQPYQTRAVEAVADCFAGQPYTGNLSYRMDPGSAKGTQIRHAAIEEGFRNADFSLTGDQLLANVQAVQKRQNLPLSTSLKSTAASRLNLDIEMETGTGKTYCYIKSIFELNKRHGWSKFVVVVPSIAIREGVHKTLSITADHFQEIYRKKARFFVYNSRSLHDLESFSSGSGIQVMIINIQAFNATGKDNRRIYDELDDFQSRKPIDVLSANRPILILDEPQKMEGKKTLEALAKFRPLFILRYSATHKTEHDKIFRLDALDAYNQKLVKKISVRGISVRGLSGTSGYLYLDSIEVSATKPPEAKIELEIKRDGGGIQRVLRRVGKGSNLFELSGELGQYKGFVVSDIDARTGEVRFTNGEAVCVGEASGDVTELALRRIQIREAIKAHLEKERDLFARGVKALSLFFIDEVAKYRDYAQPDEKGEYARIFEEEYASCVAELQTKLLLEPAYKAFLERDTVGRIHDGYFSIDKKTKRMIDPETGARSTESDDTDAYDLILKDKERLLSHEEPVRFLFSHSALREGWDNPNVFVICTLKHSGNDVARRQEVGRGLRLCVDRDGNRVDEPAIVHQVNELTVVASESYKDFVTALQKEIREALAQRPRQANVQFFTGKVVHGAQGNLEVTPEMAKQLYKYLLKNDFIDDSADDAITQTYHDAREKGTLPPLPPDLQPHAEGLFQLVDSVFRDGMLPGFADGRKPKVENQVNANIEKSEFQELWSRINRQSIYAVDFDSQELVSKAIRALDAELRVSPLQYVVERGTQADQATLDSLDSKTAFVAGESRTDVLQASIHSRVTYDLVGTIASETQLRRATVARILSGIQPQVFAQFKTNPEDFLAKAIRIIDEQKATVIVEHIEYHPLESRHCIEIFTADKHSEEVGSAFHAQRHVLDYVFTDSTIERTFVEELDRASEVVVYAKLPRGFRIPTPVGDYNPDWAIAFQTGTVKHVYFVAETKGSLSSLDLREVEKAKIGCARKFFAKIASDQVKYDVVDTYAKLRELVA